MQTRTDAGKRGVPGEEGLIRFAFDSLAELGDYIANTKRTWACNSSVSADVDEWTGYATFKQAVTMAQNGWIEGAQRSQKALKAFMPGTPKPETKVDFYGFRPHVPRFCAGAPDCMVRRDPIDAETGMGKVLTLAVPVNALGDVSGDSMSNFGVAVAQYVNQLETDGTRVELIGMIVSIVSGKRLAHSWLIKRAEQPLDLAVVAFSIGHPAMFRRLGFALRERAPVRQDSGYGRTQPGKLSDLINAPAGTVILNGMANADRYASTPEKALEYVTTEIEKAMEAQYAE